MGRRHLGLGLVLGIFILVPTSQAHAQFGNGGINTGDPFSLYFGYYLPHQAAIAAQATPLDTINAAQAARQAAVVRDQRGLLDPIGSFGDEDIDPTRPYGRSGSERIQRPHTFATSTTGARMRGSAPMPFYSRTHRYYPTLRAGAGPNQNLAVSRAGGRFPGGPGR